MDNASGWNFNDITRFNKNRAELEWLYTFYKADNTIVFTNKNGIDGKAHKKHVDGLATGDNKRFALRERRFIQEADHPRKKCVRNDTFLSDDRIF